MSETPEGRVKRFIKDYLKALGCIWVYSPVQLGYGAVGIPDLVGCREGRMFAVEVKAPGKEGRLTPLQRLTLDAIAASGGLTCVATCVQDVQDMFEYAGPWGIEADCIEPPPPGDGDDGHPDRAYVRPT
jgi:VRR-NUC domain